MKPQLETNKFGNVMHLLAVLTIIFGLFDGYLSYAETVMQQIVIVLLTIKYFVLAIFFEVLALNCREIVYQDIDENKKTRVSKMFEFKPSNEFKEQIVPPEEKYEKKRTTSKNNNKT